MSVSFDNDEEIIKAIKSGGKNRKDALSYVFTDLGLKKRVSNFVSYYKGNQDDIHDVLVESIIIFDRNIRYNKFEEKSTLLTYAYSIAKWYWINKSREEKRTAELKAKIESESIDIKNPELLFIEEETKFRFERILQHLSEKCKEILKYWSLSYSYKEIAEKLEIENHNSIRKQKLYCQRKLAIYLKDNPQLIPGVYNGTDK
jgi:RNA polymerase sigma factor (sigma-70 family)